MLAAFEVGRAAFNKSPRSFGKVLALEKLQQDVVGILDVGLKAVFKTHPHGFFSSLDREGGVGGDFGGQSVGFVQQFFGRDYPVDQAKRQAFLGGERDTTEENLAGFGPADHTW